MKLAYTLDQSIALEIGKHYFDLHNDYELVSAIHDRTRCYLSFVKREAKWVKDQDPTHLIVVFEQVTFFQVSVGTRLPNSIEEIGFKGPDDWDLDWFSQTSDAETMHILFRLEADEFVRIGAGSSLVLTNLLVP